MVVRCQHMLIRKGGGDQQIPTYITKAALRFDGLLVLGQVALKNDDAPYVHTGKRKA